jgi:hypothetical protein
VLKFKVGQVVYVIEDRVYDRVRAVDATSEYPYSMDGEIGVEHEESDLRALTDQEKGNV